MRAEINVTPLIDVMLVLLILFMVVTPTVTRGIDAHLPEASDRRSGRQTTPLLVTIEPASFRLNQTAILTPAELETRLREQLATRTDRVVFIRSDGDVTYERFVDAMDIARGAGAERIGIVTGGPPRP